MISFPVLHTKSWPSVMISKQIKMIWKWWECVWERLPSLNLNSLTFKCGLWNNWWDQWWYSELLVNERRANEFAMALLPCSFSYLSSPATRERLIGTEYWFICITPFLNKYSFFMKYLSKQVVVWYSSKSGILECFPLDCSFVQEDRLKDCSYHSDFFFSFLVLSLIVRPLSMSLCFSLNVWEAETLAFLLPHLSLCQTSNCYHGAELPYKSIHLNANTVWHFTHLTKKVRKKMAITFIWLETYLKILHTTAVQIQQQVSMTHLEKNVRFIIKPSCRVGGC